ncbi:MAG: ABC transporter substrate-binding protein [Treponema sp.]|nr:ABC transporter substrate-binding protein [Treponema sp.]
MKKKITAVLLAVIVLGFTGCIKDDTIRVLLDWTPNTNHTGLFVALEKGWFAEEGLKVTITQPPEDNALILLALQKAEFAVYFQDWLGPAIAKERDALPVTAVAAIISHNTSGIMSLKEIGIERPADLGGKRYATWDMPIVTAIIRHIVENDGGNFDSIRMIPNFATDVFSALKTDVDAIWIYYAWDGIAAEIGGFDFNYIDIGKTDNTLDYYTPILLTNTNWAASNPETTRKFLSAVSRGYYYAIENPLEAAEILLKHAPELDRQLVIQSQVYLQSQYKADSRRWGEIDPQRWGNFFTWMYEQGLLETNIGQGGFTNEYLP